MDTIYYIYNAQGEWVGTSTIKRYNATEIAPPHIEGDERLRQRFDESKNAWEMVEDYSRLVVLDEGGERVFLDPFAPVPNRCVYIPTPIYELDEARNNAKKIIREKRKAKEYGGFDFLEMRWDSAEKDELRINSAIKMFEMAGMTEFPGWKVSEGVYVTATLELLQGAALAMMQHYAGAFAMEAAKTAELEALAAAEDATAADIEAWIAGAMREGWPG